MPPSAVSSVPVNFNRAPPGPTVTRAPSPQGTDSELSPDDQQQAQLLMQVYIYMLFYFDVLFMHGLSLSL